MERKLPTPVCQNLVVCRQIILDQFAKEYYLLGVLHGVTSLDFPTVATVSIYAECKAVLGSYNLELQLQDLDGVIHWRHTFDVPLVCRDPLLVGIIPLHQERIYFPKPGKYDLILLANGEEMRRQTFSAFLATTTLAAPPEPERSGH
jgi:hypothetical protein